MQKYSSVALLAIGAWAGSAEAVPNRITDGLVGEWHLDSTVLGLVLDTSGNGHHGGLSGSGLGYGWYKNGLALSGTGHVRVTSPGNLNVGSGSVTIAAWIKMSSPGSSSVKSIVENRGSNGQGYHFAVYQGKFLLAQVSTPSGWSNYISTGVTLSPNRWHHVAVVINRTVWPFASSFYIDGFRVGDYFTARTGAMDNTNNPFYIGAHKDWTSSYFRDRIDDVLVFDRVLQNWEIWTIMNPGRPVYDPGFWNNNSTRRANNNCYNYASNNATNTFAQPGRAHGQMYTSLTCSNVRAAAIADGLEEISYDPSYILNFKGAVALVVDPGWDYHFYRLEEDGTWSHKPGSTNARNTDNSGNIITDPRTANRGGYTDFCGFFYLWTDITQGLGHERVN